MMATVPCTQFLFILSWINFDLLSFYEIC
jgi:hypothetical protein